MCSYALSFPKGEAGCYSESVSGYLSYDPTQPIENTAFPAYPTAYLQHSLNGTRTLTFATYTSTSTITALSPVSKPGSVQTTVGGNIYTNLICPSTADRMDNAGWVFSVTNSTGPATLVKLVAATNNASATNNLHDQSLLSSGSMGHVTRGINGQFSRMACTAVAQ